MSAAQIQGLQLVVIFSTTLTLIAPVICWTLTLPVERIFGSREGDVTHIVHQILS